MLDDNSMDQNYEDENVEYIDDGIDPEVVDSPVDHSNQIPINEYPQGSSTAARGAGVVTDLMDFSQDVTTMDAERIILGLEQFSKSQLVRFLDITVIGPLMLYYAYKGKLSVVERSILGLIGIGTVTYNARNFLKKRQMLTGKTLAEVKDIYKDYV